MGIIEGWYKESGKENGYYRIRVPSSSLSLFDVGASVVLEIFHDACCCFIRIFFRKINVAQ